VKTLKIIACLIFCSYLQKAQFSATILEGDFLPSTEKVNFEEQNKKYKDPPHICFDTVRNLWHATWTQFDSYKSKSKQDVSVIYYARSSEGKIWSSPKQINTISGNCLDGDSTVKGPMPCIGLKGEVFVVWASPKGLAFQCSLDSGRNWLKEEKIIGPLKNGWACTVDGIKTNGLPTITCDYGGGEFKGRLYVCWSDEKNGVKNKDVFLIYSDDKGEHWTEPILVSYRPNHKEQFKPELKVDPTNGFVYILYFDKQNYPEGKETDLFLALSKNGGLKFDYYKVNQKPFLFNSNFTELVVDSSVKVRWLQPDLKNRFSLFEALINDTAITGCIVRDYNEDMQGERSIKFSDKIKYPFKLKHSGTLTAIITKPLEPGFEKLVIKEKRVVDGDNVLEIDTKKLGLKKGNYVLTLYYHYRNSFVWITEE
jgi:hypothetical protein